MAIGAAIEEPRAFRGWNGGFRLTVPRILSRRSSTFRNFNECTAAKNNPRTSAATPAASSTTQDLLQNWRTESGSAMNDGTHIERVGALARENQAKDDENGGYKWATTGNIYGRKGDGGRDESRLLAPSARFPFRSSTYDRNAATWRTSSQQSLGERIRLYTAEGTNQQSPLRPFLNANYRGDTTSRYFMDQVPGLRDELNCAVWIEDLPVGITTEWFLEKVHTGAVFALHINESTTTQQNWAAKLVFMTHVGAANFLEYMESPNGQLAFGGAARAKWNLHGHVEYQNQGESRVLKIVGRTPFMDLRFWMEFLEGIENFKYQISHAGQWDMPDGTIVVEIGFGRLDSQAMFVRKTIMEDIFCGSFADVHWAQDPCAQ
ncbi:hypothetical protein DL95DRAFT_519394 [Leptodontidium sp. 2 PMI_412]|nr:hypothetical protein DL95DRAFT_519394 [Leptodontidium sp. 2 PMI_412]